MLLTRRRLTVVSLLAVFCQKILWREVEAQTTGQDTATTSTSFSIPSPNPSFASPPATPSSSGGLPAGVIPPTDGQTTSPSLPPTGGQPPGGAQPPGTQPTTDGQTLWPGSPPTDGPSTSDGQAPSPPSGGVPSGGQPPSPPPPDGQPPSPLSGGPSPGGLPPSIAPTDGQPPAPPSGGVPSGGQPPSPPPPDGQAPAPPSGVLPPGGLPPSIAPTDGQPPAPPSGGVPSGGQPPSPPPTDGLPPVPSSGGLPPGGQPQSPLPTDDQPPSGPSSTDDGLPPGGGADSGVSSLNATTSPSSISSTDAAHTAPNPDSFLITSLRWKCSPEDAPADDQIGPQWDYNIRSWIQRIFMTYSDFQKYSCTNRCGLDERDTSSSVSFADLSKCYCDNLCDQFGDCCFDFNALCKKSVNPQGSPLTLNETCLAQENYLTSKAIYQGYAVWSTCPESWTESSVRQKCQREDKSDLLKNLPVFDKDSHVTYRNIFCARCNGAINTRYWKVQFDCFLWFNTTNFNLSNMMNLLTQNCSVTKRPEVPQLKYLKRCIPHFQDCFKVSQEKNESYCQTDCLRYAFPLCQSSDRTDNTIWRFRNPQCALCNGFKPNELETDCEFGSSEGFLPLTILFDFSSTSKYSIVVDDKDQKTHQILHQVWSCAHGEVYDPYAAKCRKIVLVGSQDAYSYAQNATGTINKTELNHNCTFVHFNKSDFEQLTNGTVFLKPHNKIYSNDSYTVNDGQLLLCVSFSRNATTTAKERNVRKIKTTPASLHLFTAIGCIVSMASLVLLLITYMLFPELRNLPGKIIINLSFSLLLYQSVFFSAVKTSNQEQCIIVAVLLHFLVLCSFTWMNVMAYDVHRIFNASDGVAANQHGGCNKRLIKYCLYAWGAPVLVVSICVIIDQVVKEGSIGYGRGEAECFISEPRAILFVFVVPVALLMLFNLFALGHTVVHIGKTKKRTQQVTNQRHGTGIALISVKMASVMGITWILGIAANFDALAFLWYPYVVLNSLQGLFIFLSFAVSGRALELHRNKLPNLKYLKARSEKKNRSRSNMTLESTYHTDSERRPTQDAHDTRL